MRFPRNAVRYGGAAWLVLALVLPVQAVIPDTDIAFLTSSTSLAAQSPSFMPSLVRPLFAVFLIGLLLWAALYLSYRRQRRETESVLIHVLAAAPIAQGVMIQIVDVGGVLFVLSLSKEGTTLLGQITEREKISEIRTRVAQEARPMALAPVPFKKALEKLFRKPQADSKGSESDSARPSARDRVLQEALERVRRLNPVDKEKS